MIVFWSFITLSSVNCIFSSIADWSTSCFELGSVCSSSCSASDSPLSICVSNVRNFDFVSAIKICLDIACLGILIFPALMSDMVLCLSIASASCSFFTFEGQKELYIPDMKRLTFS